MANMANEIMAIEYIMPSFKIESDGWDNSTSAVYGGAKELHAHLENKKTTPVMVFILSPGCIHCVNLKPTLNQLLEKCAADKTMAVAEVDADFSDEILSRYKVSPSGYPTIGLIKSGGGLEEYTDERSIDAFKKWYHQKKGVAMKGGKKSRKQKRSRKRRRSRRRL